MYKSNNTLPLGSYSSGTMLERDLVPCFMEALRSVESRRAHAKSYEYRKVINYLEGSRKKPYDKQEIAEIEEQMAYLCDELFDILNQYVPDYCYFGAHPGDGSDFGVWICDEALQEDIHTGTILAVDGLEEVSEKLANEGRIPGMVLETTDHGNQTLYSINPTITEDEDGYLLSMNYRGIWSTI